MLAYTVTQYIGLGILAVIAVAMFVIIGMLAYHKARFMQSHSYLFEKPSQRP